MGGCRHTALVQVVVTITVAFALAQAAAADAARHGDAEPPACSCRPRRARPPRPPPTSAADVRGSPLPGSARKSTRPSDTPGPWRSAGRIILTPVRLAAQLTFALPRLGLWLYDRFTVSDASLGGLDIEARHLDLYPVALYESGLGLHLAAEAVYERLWSRGSSLAIYAGYGGRFAQRFQARASSADLAGERLAIETALGYDIVDNARFFGIGNRELTVAAPAAVAAPTDVAVATRFHYDQVRVSTALATRLRGHLHATVLAALLYRNFEGAVDRDGEPALAQVYEVDTPDTLHTGLLGLQLRYASRPASAHPHLPPGTGWSATASATLARGIGRDPSRYVRYGAELMHHLDIYAGDRVLRLRAALEAVTGDLDEVPFVDLPQLGGATELRGYVRGGFRDRVAALASIEYRYPIQRTLTGYLFVDAGRVYRSLDDLTTSGMRVGYGAGLRLSRSHVVVSSLTVASSIDGGVQVLFWFQPGDPELAWLGDR